MKETANQARRDATEAEKSAAAATKAVSDAIRRQLTTPGSVTPDEQVRLLLADRDAPTPVEWRNHTTNHQVPA